jgi:hypothetical protein
VHFFRDYFALIQHARRVPGTELYVDAFLFTSLLPSAPKILLNVESDDYGIVETRDCGCPFQALGFSEHIRGVHSFQKLTGEGVTLVGSEMLKVLQEVLPNRFGGSSLDYQLVEEEDDQGFTRLILSVSPSVGPLDEQLVVETVHSALRKSSGAAEQAQAYWRQAGTLRVKREEPVWTSRGKLLPLHLARQAPQQEGVAVTSESRRGS